MIQKHAAKAAREHPEKPTYSFKPQINDSYFVSGICTCTTLLRIESAHAVVRRVMRRLEIRVVRRVVRRLEIRVVRRV